MEGIRYGRACFCLITGTSLAKVISLNRLRFMDTGFLDAVSNVFSPGSSPADPMPVLSDIPQVINPVYNITSVGTDQPNLAFSSSSSGRFGNTGHVEPRFYTSAVDTRSGSYPGSFYVRNVNSWPGPIGGLRLYHQNQTNVPFQAEANTSSTLQQWQPAPQPTSTYPLASYMILNWDSQAFTADTSSNALWTYPLFRREHAALGLQSLLLLNHNLTIQYRAA